MKVENARTVTAVYPTQMSLYPEADFMPRLPHIELVAGHVPDGLHRVLGCRLQGPPEVSLEKG